jgi:pathogen-inducible salicylic acid glucosyltransferase
LYSLLSRKRLVLSDHTIWTQKAYINAGRSTPTRERKAQRLVLLIREMEKQERICHVVVIPYPAQGHINPMIQFSKRLASKGLQVTLVIFSSQTLSTPASLGSVKVVTISDSSDTGSSSIGDLLKQFQATVAPKLPQLVVELGISSGHPVSCLVYDSFMPWVPGLPPLDVDELPSFVHDMESEYSSILTLVVNQFLNFRGPDWVFVNSFNSLEEEVPLKKLHKEK